MTDGPFPGHSTEETGTNEKYAICKKCEEFDDYRKICNICHCFMILKTQLPWAKCPKEKW
jgi:hypothetical protein